MKSVNKTKTLAFALFLFGMLALTPAAMAGIKVDVAKADPTGTPITAASGATFSVTFRVENNNTGGDTGKTNTGNYTLTTSPVLTLVSGPPTSASYTLAKMDTSTKVPFLGLTWTFQAPTGPVPQINEAIKLDATVTSTTPTTSGTPPLASAISAFYHVTVLAPADTTPPVVTGTASLAPNAAGWNNTDVSISWSASDPESGIASGPTPSSQTVSTEGAGQVFTSSATNGAGLVGTGSVTLNIDKTAPATGCSLSGTIGTGGWYKSDVDVTLTTTDGISGPKEIHYILNGGTENTVPGSSALFTVSTEGVNTLEYWAIDNADNAESPHQTETINIDKSPPTMDVTLDGTSGNSPWYVSPVQVTITAGDEYSDLFLVEYNLDGDGWTTYGGPFMIPDDGIHMLDCLAVDIAGNEYPVSLDIYIDQTVPLITAGRTPAANADGWNNTDVTAEYSASDAMSGLASPASGSHVFSAEGAGQSVTFTVFDIAGNSASATVDNVNIDKTAPATVKTLGGLIGNNNWYVTDVSVTLTATDGLSGIKEVHYVLDGGGTQTYSGPFTIATDGIHTLEHWAVDKAGNEEEHATLGIKVDKTAPVVTATLPDTGRGVGVYVLGEVVDATWSAEDPVPGSGLATDPAEGTITLDTSSIGTQTLTIPAGTAQDNAGNESQAVTVTYYIEYGFNGLLSPYQEPPKSYKVTSSIPLKWQYTDDFGNPVDSPNADPFPFIWLGSRSTMPDPDGDLPIVLNDPGSSGLRYDSLTKTWQYNWQTKGLAPGTYAIFIYSSLTGQADGPFAIQLKK